MAEDLNNEPEPLFSKRLTNTDVSSKLVYPTEHLQALHKSLWDRFKMNLDLNLVWFKLRDPNYRVWYVRCFTRDTGQLRPVIMGQWAQCARANGLNAGDLVCFYLNPDPDPDAPAVYFEHVVGDNDMQ